MRIKVQVIENGIAKDVFYDSGKDLIAIRIETPELEILAKSHFEGKPMLFAPPSLARNLRENKPLFDKFIKDWPLQFYSGHSAPTGSIVDPNGQILKN